MSRFYALKVAAVIRETAQAVSIVFDIPEQAREHFDFLAGQYVTVEKEINGTAVRRSYSICAATDAPLQIGIKEIPGGLFSSYANRSLKAGDVLQVAAPEGRFVFTPTAEGKALAAFAAGSGITPVFSIVKTALAAHPDNTVYLTYGNTSPEETLFYKALKELEAAHPNRLFITWVYSRANEENAFFGRIDKALVNRHLKQAHSPVDAYYLCGPEAMIQNVQQALVEKGISENQIHHELFFATSESVEAGTANALTLICDQVTHTLDNTSGKTLLEAALAAKIDVPYSCQGGVCSSCIARVEEGAAKMETNQILTESEVEEGLVLTCQAVATTASIRVNFDAV